MKKGFTTVEALIAVGIIQILIFGALTLMQRMPFMNKKAGDELNYSVLRNQLFVLLSDDRAWFHMIQDGVRNPTLECFRRQGGPANPQRNCRGDNGQLVVHDIKGVVRYDFSDTTTGILSNGQVCQGFSMPPNPPNPACPLRLDLTWEAVCPQAGGTDCVNPLIQVNGNYIWNGTPEQKSPPMHRLNFRIFHSTNYCPPPLGAINVSLQPGLPNPALVSPTVNPNQIQSSETAAVPSNQVGQFNDDLIPCRTSVISYQEEITANTDPANRSRVCLKDNPAPGGPCRYEVVRSTSAAGRPTFTLLYNGGSPQVMTTNLSISSGSMFTILVKKNRVEFLLDSKSFYTWPQKLTEPFRVQFYPASQAFSPNGFFNITPVVPAVTP